MPDGTPSDRHALPKATSKAGMRARADKIGATYTVKRLPAASTAESVVVEALAIRRTLSLVPA